MSKKQGATGPRVSGITVYPRGKKWAFIIYGEPDLLTGKRERVYRGGFTEDADAWSAAIRVKSEVGAGSYLHPSRRTVRAFLREWLTAVEHSIKPTTYANYVDNVNAYVVPVLGDRKLQEITVPVLNAFYRQLLEAGRRKADTNTAMYEYWMVRRHRRDGLGPPPQEISKACGTTIYAARTAVGRYRRGRVPRGHSAGLAPKSVKNIHRLLHRALSDAVAWQYLSTNPAAHASLPRERRGVDNRPKPWTVDELAIWLRVALTDRFAGIWVLAATTGMRRSELAGVQRDLLNLETGTLTVGDTRVVVDGNAAESDGKTNSGRRTIPSTRSPSRHCVGTSICWRKSEPSSAPHTPTTAGCSASQTVGSCTPIRSPAGSTVSWIGPACATSVFMTSGTPIRQSHSTQASTPSWSATGWGTPT